MTDYGHELLFGTFISPAVQPVMHAVDLAIVADRAGLDLATFQDHPYLPTFHDTWTLLSYVASRTERIHVSGNVLNLPLRQPAVVARSAASLDLLSGGRLPERFRGRWMLGRDPSDVRRLLNISGQFASSGSGLLDGPPAQWAEQLAGLTLDYGISGFILMADDVTVTERFAAEVAPATRALVAAERAGAATR
jgi:alkanesulfonate monooxygenase SsuD/methylene tetrahydromethanopterin reductase-like flavin-dependent oxidoreductase (luciferase family)